MNFRYHLSKANVVADALSRISMGSTSHVEDEKKELVRYIHKLDRLVVWLVDCTSGYVPIHPSSE